MRWSLGKVFNWSRILKGCVADDRLFLFNSGRHSLQPITLTHCASFVNVTVLNEFYFKIDSVFSKVQVIGKRAIYVSELVCYCAEYVWLTVQCFNSYFRQLFKVPTNHLHSYYDSTEDATLNWISMHPKDRCR